jgi:hypothetical protein
MKSGVLQVFEQSDRGRLAYVGVPFDVPAFDHIEDGSEAV